MLADEHWIEFDFHHIGADDRVRMTGPAELEHEGVLPEAIGAGGG